MNTRSWRTPVLVLVCGCAIMTITFGVRAGFGLFLQPMAMEYGWGRGVFSLSMALQNLAWGALGAVAGGVADRYGPGRVIAGAAVCYILGLIGMSVISSPVGMYLNCGLLLGMALGGASFGIILAIIAAPSRRRSAAWPWASRRRRGLSGSSRCCRSPSSSSRLRLACRADRTGRRRPRW